MRRHRIPFGFLAVVLVLGLLGGCTKFGVWSPTAKKDMQVVAADLAPLIGDLQKAVAYIQQPQNYAFMCALVQGTLQVAGIKVTQEQMDLAKPWIAIADPVLKVGGPIITALKDNEPIPPTDPALVQEVITDAQVALPAQMKALMANPAFAALYAAYLAGQTNVSPPAAVPTS